MLRALLDCCSLPCRYNRTKLQSRCCVRWVGIGMKNITVKNVFRWLLAAWMLLATSVMSSVMHGHGGGSLACQHDESDCTRRCSLVPTVFRGDNDGDPSLSAVDVHRAGALAQWGNLPSLGRPIVPHDRSQCHWCAWMKTVSAAQGIRTLSKNPTFDRSWSDGFTSVLTDGVGRSEQFAAFGSDIAPSLPLCDRARHARSGVQLA